MRHTFAKLMAMLLMLTLVLTGCNLIEVDQVAVIEEELAVVEKDFSAVMAEYDGGTVTKFDVVGLFCQSYNYFAELYASFGMELTEDDVNGMVEEALMTEVTDRAVAIEFANRGLTLERTEEDLRAEAAQTYQETFDSYLGFVEGDTDEVKAANARYQLYVEGLTEERLYEMLLAQERYDALRADVEAEIAEVSDEELQAAYEAKLEEDEATYAESPAQFENDIDAENAAVCWIPEGYRTVKHVLVIPDAAALQAVTDARAAADLAEVELEALMTELDYVNDNEPAEGEVVRTAEEIQADIDAKSAEVAELKGAVEAAETACIASVQADVDQIYEKLAEGRSFDAVMEVFGEDPGMQNEPNKSTGYYVCAESTRWDPDFTAGAMALANIGDYSSEPVVSTSGVHVIYYNADVASGPVALEEVKDALYDSTLESLRAEHFEAGLLSWVEAINPVYHMEAWMSE